MTLKPEMIAPHNYATIMTHPWDGVKFGHQINEFNDTHKNYYVYGHYDPKDGEHPDIDGLMIPFYIGMGFGNRMRQIDNRSREHRQRRAFSFRSDKPWTYEYIEKGLDCHEALVLESKLIAFWGLESHDGPRWSGMEHCLINLKREPCPEKYKTSRRNREVI